MTGLTTTVDYGPDADITTIVVDGELDLSTTTTVRAALLKALAECPVAVIVDMTRCHVITTAALAVFPSVRRLYVSCPAVVIAVVGLIGDEDSRMPAALGRIPTFPTTEAADLAIMSNVVSDRRVSRGSNRALGRQPSPPVRTRLPWGSPAAERVAGTLLDIRAIPGNGALRVSLSGEIDIRVADQLTYVLAVELPAQDHLIIDFTKVTFCDSAGIVALVRLRNHLAEAGRTMSLVKMRENVRRVFELTGLIQFLDIRD